MTEKIALVNMCYPKDREVYAPPLGLLSIASFLRQFDIESRIYDISINVRCEEFTAEMMTDYLHLIEERIIGIATWDSVLPKIILSVQELKRTKDKIVILGGPTATNLSTQLVEEFPCIDYCVEGEGEKTILSLLSWLASDNPDLCHLPVTVVGRKENYVFRGTLASDFVDVQDIPIINYEFCDVKRYSRFEASSTRGCPFRCEFCSINSTLDNKIRIRPLESIFEELSGLFRNTECETVNFVDDNFCLYSIRLQEFCQLFKTRFPDKRWTCYFRLSDLTKENVDMMVDSGCVGVFIGIETGNTNLLEGLGKGIDEQALLSRIKYATAVFDVTASFIWGFPDESESQLIDTFETISQITEYDNIIVDLYQLAPLSGTPLTGKILNNLVFDEEAISGFILPPYVPKLSEKEKNLICRFPQIFSAFYHENTERFGNKYHMVNKFLGERIN
jgi:radical SAM superfamily enzyme YgiQ (UPF0313 family)